LFEFISYGTKGVKQFKTCNNCHQRFEKRRKNSCSNKNCQTDILEIIDIDFLSEIIINLIPLHPKNSHVMNMQLFIISTNFVIEILLYFYYGNI
jgi:hypothetical protein